MAKHYDGSESKLNLEGEIMSTTQEQIVLMQQAMQEMQQKMNALQALAEKEAQAQVAKDKAVKVPEDLSVPPTISTTNKAQVKAVESSAPLSEDEKKSFERIHDLPENKQKIAFEGLALAKGLDEKSMSDKYNQYLNSLNVVGSQTALFLGDEDKYRATINSDFNSEGHSGTGITFQSRHFKTPIGAITPEFTVGLGKELDPANVAPGVSLVAPSVDMGNGHQLLPIVRFKDNINPDTGGQTGEVLAGAVWNKGRNSFTAADIYTTDGNHTIFNRLERQIDDNLSIAVNNTYATKSGNDTLTASMLYKEKISPNFNLGAGAYVGATDIINNPSPVVGAQVVLEYGSAPESAKSKVKFDASVDDRDVKKIDTATTEQGQASSFRIADDGKTKSVTPMTSNTEYDLNGRPTQRLASSPTEKPTESSKAESADDAFIRNQSDKFVAGSSKAQLAIVDRMLDNAEKHGMNREYVKEMILTQFTSYHKDQAAEIARDFEPIK